MSDFVDLPLQKKLNRRNIFSRVDKLENKTDVGPSARVNALSDLTQNLGEQVAGVFKCIDPATGVLRGYITATPRAEAPGYHLAFFDNSGVLQVGVDADNGKFYAAAGQLWMDGGGISVAVPATYNDDNAYKFVSTDTTEGGLYFWTLGSYRQLTLRSYGYGTRAFDLYATSLSTDGSAKISIMANAGGIAPTIVLSSSDALTSINDFKQDIDTKIWGTSSIFPVLHVDAGGSKAYYNGAEIGWCVIEDINLSSSDAASFDFQNIPATYRHLKIELYGRSDRAANVTDGVKMKLNNDAGNNYLGLLQWAGGATEQATAAGPVLITYFPAASSPAGYMSNSEITIFNYANANAFKSYQARGGDIETNSAGNLYIYDAVGEWLSNNAINRVTIYPATGTNFKQYSRATLYGMR